MSEGVEVAYELAQHTFETDEVHPVHMKHLLCFYEHGHNHVSGRHKKYSIRLLGKWSSSDAIAHREGETFFKLDQSYES